MPKPNVVLKASSLRTPPIVLGKPIRKPGKCKMKLYCSSLHTVYVLNEIRKSKPHESAVMIMSTINRKEKARTLDSIHYKTSSGSYAEGGKDHISYRKYNRAALKLAYFLGSCPLLCELFQDPEGKCRNSSSRRLRRQRE